MLRAVLMAVVVVASLVAPLVYAGPQLADDVSATGGWTIADDLAIREFKCTRWYLLVSTCNVEYVNRRDPARAGGSLNYLVLGSWAGERALLLRSADGKGRISTTVGLEHVTQRMIAYGVFLLIALSVAAGVLWRFLRMSRAERPATPAAVPDRAAPADVAQAFGRRTARA